jgi:fructokinase
MSTLPKTPAVICLGELLIDFVCTDIGQNLQRGEHFLKKPGGAPANVAAAVARLGGNGVFVGSVGQDPFGDFLRQYIADFGVNTEHVAQVASPTTLALVAIDADGERDFAFNRGADAELALSQAQCQALATDNIVHFGAATALLPGKLQQSYRDLLAEAVAQRAIISFDPNFRDALWGDHTEAFVAQCQPFIDAADLIKVSDEECLMLTGAADLEHGSRQLALQSGGLVLVTLGAKGCLVSTEHEQFVVPAFVIEVLDTTGAGDAFIGACLYQIAKDGALPRGQQAITEMVKFGNKVSGLVCSALGPMTALPTLDEVMAQEFVEKTHS